MNYTHIIDTLRKDRILPKEALYALLTCEDAQVMDYLQSQAQAVTVYGKDIYIRALIECTNICHRDCLYCGIRKSNTNVHRYCLSKEDILMCCKHAYAVGIRTFVLQGGESLTDAFLLDIVVSIKSIYGDCAVTLSFGEKSYESYQALFKAGADRYLLRHETANNALYTTLHPDNMSLEKRKDCIASLKEIGYQVGCGFMVGAPYQTIENIIEDLLYIQEINPHMVGIGPFIPHKDTPFFDKKAGSVELTLKLLSIIRLMLPHVLLPATTALGSLVPDGIERGIAASANVVMPNFTPGEQRGHYLLYNNKTATGFETSEGYLDLKKVIENMGYTIKSSRGDAYVFE